MTLLPERSTILAGISPGSKSGKSRVGVVIQTLCIQIFTIATCANWHLSGYIRSSKHNNRFGLTFRDSLGSRSWASATHGLRVSINKQNKPLTRVTGGATGDNS